VGNSSVLTILSQYTGNALCLQWLRGGVAKAMLLMCKSIVIRG